MGKKSEKYALFSIRVPMWLYNYLKDESARQERSLNKQIVLHLKEAIDIEKVESQAESPREEGRETDTDVKQEGGAASNILG